jgi:hypothetical protein
VDRPDAEPGLRQDQAADVFGVLVCHRSVNACVQFFDG